MAEPTGAESDEANRRRSPPIGEQQPSPSPPPRPPSDHHEGQVAGDGTRERQVSLPALPPELGFRNTSPDPANPATPLLLNNGDLPDYSDLSNTSSFRQDNEEGPRPINRVRINVLRPRKTAIPNWRKTGYACLFLTGISLSTAMILIGMHYIGQEPGDGSGQVPSRTWEKSRDMYLVILGGLSLFFVTWHAAALLFGLCSAGTNFSLLCLHWAMRLCHFGVIFLVAFISFVLLLMLEHTPPDVFEWDPMDAIMLLSILMACVMVMYCSVELVVDLCVECYHSCQSMDGEYDDEEHRNELLL